MIDEFRLDRGAKASKLALAALLTRANISSNIEHLPLSDAELLNMPRFMTRYRRVYLEQARKKGTR